MSSGGGSGGGERAETTIFRLAALLAVFQCVLRKFLMLPGTRELGSRKSAFKLYASRLVLVNRFSS